MLAAMGDRDGLRAGRGAGRAAADEPLVVRRRRRTGPQEAGGPRRPEGPPLAAFALMAVAIALILGNDAIQRRLALGGPTPEIVGLLLSAVGVMMLRPPRPRR
jgi:hypothetical protein